MTTQYLDYELELGAATGGDQWPLTVIQSPAGQGRGVLTLPSPPELIALQAQRAKPHEARDLGRKLFDCLISSTGVSGPYMESLGVADAKGVGLRVKLRIIDPRLALVPWELLYEERFSEYVALSHETPVVRYAEVAQPQTPLVVKPPLRILGMVVSPTDLEPIDVKAQKAVVQTALDGLIAKGLVELTWLDAGTWRSLQQTLRSGNPRHIFHFVGHGTVDPATGEGVLAFQSEGGTAHPLSASELGRILASHKSLRLAMLNACHSATAGSTDLYTSAAATLIRRGLPAVIAMQFAIKVNAAVELARTFYEALADGLPVEAALTDARIAVSVEHPSSLDWAAPVLYLRAPDGVLFEVERDTVLRSAEQENAAPEPNDSVTGRPENLERIIVPDVRQLQGKQIQAAIKAIGSAYSTKASLRQMVAIQLKENLEAHVADGALNNMIFDLLEWARMRGKLTELLQGAVDGNPTSQDLREFVRTL